MIRYRADWILPIVDEPLRNSWLTVDRGRIVALGRDDDRGGADAVDLGRTVVLPGLVNAHTHLELSYLRDVVQPASRFIDWIHQLMARRREFADPSDPAILRG